MVWRADPESGPTRGPALSPATDRAAIRLTDLNPSVISPGDSLVVSGTVTAPADGSLTGAQVRLVLDRTVLDRRAAIDTWAGVLTPGRGRVLATTTLPAVTAGQSAPFTVSAAKGAVRDGAAFAALPLSVEVTEPGADAPVGVTHTFLAWHARKEYDRLQVATVLPVTLDPDLDLFSRDDPTRVAAWQRAIGPTSPLQTILDATRGTPVGLAVDPSVFGPTGPTGIGVDSPDQTPTATPSQPSTPSPSVPATGPGPSTPGPTTSSPTTPSPTTSSPTTPSPTGIPADGTPSPSASATIAALALRLAAELRGRSLWALPYADADLAATVDGDPTDPLVRDLIDRSALVEQAVGQPVRADVAWPADGLLPTGREAGLKTLFSGTTVGGPAAIVVDERAVTAAGPYTPTARRVATGGTRLLAYDPRLSALLPSRADSDPVKKTQRYLAETLVLLGERAGTPRSVLVVAPRPYDPDGAALESFVAATSSAPWITPIDPSALLRDDLGDQATRQQPPAKVVASAAPPSVLTSARLLRMGRQRDSLRSVATVLRDGKEFERVYRELLDELASVRWRYAPEEWTRLNDTVVADTKQATSAIKVVGQSVNFFTQTGALQVTVDNGLDYEVDGIRLVLAPTNPRLQIDEQPGPITIAPNSKRVVPVPVTAVAAGNADIRAFLTTADGTPIGSPTVIPVSANPIDGTVYWVGGALVVLVLLGGVVRAIVRGTSRIDEIGDPEVTASLRARRGPDVGEEER